MCTCALTVGRRSDLTMSMYTFRLPPRGRACRKNRERLTRLLVGLRGTGRGREREGKGEGGRGGVLDMLGDTSNYAHAFSS